MGIKVSGIIIEGHPDFKNRDFKFQENIFEYKKLNNLSPQNFSIAFTADKTLLFYDSFLENILTEELEFSDFEKQVLEFFPNAMLLSIIINDTISFAGYSFSVSNIKIRVKATVENEIFIDKGILIGTESNIYDNFLEHFKKSETAYNSFKIKTKELDEIQFQKAVLKLRDKLYDKNNLENEHNYTNGTLDNLVIENLLSHILNKTHFEIEDEIFFYQLRNKKFELLKDFTGCLQNAYELHKNR